MYENHWNLTRRPFENRLETDAYYPSETHQAAILKLRYAIENRRSAAILCGQSGMGKTLVVDALTRQLGQEFAPTCNLVFPHMDSHQLLQYVVDCLDAGGEESENPSGNLIRFEKFLGANLEKGQHALLVVDEAHLLEENNLLEPLRLLLNLEAKKSEGESAWTLVLVGQPILLSHVERNHALDERMSVKCMLNRFTVEESIAYIEHRLRVCGADLAEVFEYPALERIHLLTEGVPRRINRLCDLTLMVGYAEEHPLVTQETVDNVQQELVTPRAA
ncbi:MAG: AAA family ATPase [Planctomycetota bacterium]